MEQIGSEPRNLYVFEEPCLLELEASPEEHGREHSLHARASGALDVSGDDFVEQLSLFVGLAKDSGGELFDDFDVRRGGRRGQKLQRQHPHIFLAPKAPSN